MTGLTPCCGRCARRTIRRSSVSSKRAGSSPRTSAQKMIAPEQPKLAETVSKEFPFRLNTGRIRDQWHTMTRTGLSPKLAQHYSEPFVEIHPEDARLSAIAEDDFVRLRSAHGDAIFRARIDEGQQRKSLFAPIHWNDTNASAARVRRARGARGRSIFRSTGSQSDTGFARAR